MRSSSVWSANRSTGMVPAMDRTVRHGLGVRVAVKCEDLVPHDEPGPSTQGVAHRWSVMADNPLATVSAGLARVGVEVVAGIGREPPG